MRRSHQVTAALLLGAIAAAAHASAPVLLTVNDAGDEGPGNCDSVCTLRDAIATVASGGLVDFAPQLLPATITLTHGELVILKPLNILGPGAERLAISAASASRVIKLDADSEAPIRIIGITLRDGRVAGAKGGNGGKETGQSGQPGGPAEGGCVYSVNSSLDLEQTDVRNCVAEGGAGGAGASGVPHSGVGGPGGAGGSGGLARGGAIYCTVTIPGISNKLELHESSVTNGHAIGGAGGARGRGGTGDFMGPGGTGGDGGEAYGGLIDWNTDKATLFDYALVNDSTLADGAAIGGNGGNGGTPGGNPAYGGQAYGGLVHGGMITVEIGFSTLANGNVLGGAGGNGNMAYDGFETGAAIYVNLTGQVGTQSSVIVGPGPAPLCFADMRPSKVNIDQDGTCKAPMQGDVTLFRAPNPGAGRPHYMPAYGSAVIDAATTCNNPIQLLETDQLGTARPQGSTCDLGAIEADYVFVGEFN